MTHLIQLHEFDGGIHPPQNKQQSNHRPIEQASLAEQLILPLGQHIGAPATPVVEVGEPVLKGQMLARPQGFVSASVHAPTSGTLVAIEERPVPHASGLSDLCMVIEPDFKDTWAPHQSLFKTLGVSSLVDIDPSALVDHIRNSGIAGMGGAGFPTAVKLTVKRDEHRETAIDTLILNGAECEPYITADDMLMRERASEVIQGAQILLHIVGASRCLIGVEDNKPEAIAALEAALLPLHEEHHIDVVSIPTKYPSGGEKQLIQILTGKEVPSGGIPANLGIVCQNVGTASAIYQAVHQGRPLISRVTTVTGESVNNPGNWDVPLGTPVRHLLALADFQPETSERVVMGGPMMGFALSSTDLSIVKTTNCLLAPTVEELPLNDAAMACIRCGLCTQACPAQLLPQQLYWFAKAQEFDKADQHNLFDCIECGACSYVCPSHIPLVQYYRYAKGSIREEQAAHTKSERAKERFERRLARQEREAAEKEAKRKARAEAAAQKKALAEANNSQTQSATAGTSDPLEKLQKQLSAARTAQEKTREKLSTAQQALSAGDESQASKVETLEAALAKTQEKIKTLASDLASEKKASSGATSPQTADTGDANAPERLKRKWETAQTRLNTAEDRLKDAQEQGLDTVAALKAAVEKQQQRVAEAKLAYDASLTEAKSSTALESSNTSDTADAAENKPASAPDADMIAALKTKRLAQQDRLAKAQQRLEMAKDQQLDTVDALTTAVEKQQQKLDALDQQMTELNSEGTS